MWKGTTEKQQHIIKSHEILAISYQETTLPKLFCKPKDRFTNEQKHNKVYEIDSPNCQAV